MKPNKGRQHTMRNLLKSRQYLTMTLALPLLISCDSLIDTIEYMFEEPIDADSLDMDIESDEASNEMISVENESCGNETFFGRCDDNVLIYCDLDGNMVSQECSENQTCSLIDHEFGFDCAVHENNSCHNGEHLLFCAGNNSGCLFQNSDEEDLWVTSCVSDIGSCFQGDFETPVCEDHYLYVLCNRGQPVIFDCATDGGVCRNQSCYVPSNALCDNELFKCNGDLTCINIDDQPGRCTE